MCVTPFDNGLSFLSTLAGLVLCLPGGWRRPLEVEEAAHPRVPRPNLQTAPLTTVECLHCPSHHSGVLTLPLPSNFKVG